MNENQKRIAEHLAADGNTDKLSAKQLPEWHPFAVWQTQIRQESTSVTGQHRILQSANVVDA